MNQPTLVFNATYLLPGSRICVALSGGADSVALLCALSYARQTIREPLGVGLSAVHVHHMLRGEEADKDQAFVQELCVRLNTPLQIHRVDVPAYRKTTGETLEEAARTLRYQVFHEILAGHTVDDLLTAHTLDDQAETVLMKLLRGAWTEGLAGIHPFLSPTQSAGKRILRPLLGTSRAQIVTYLQSLGQTWREDATNLDTAHARNRLRLHVLPILRAENPSIDRTLANLAELAREEEDRWQKDLARLLPQLLLPGTPVRGGGRSVSTSGGATPVALDIDRLSSLDNPTRRRVLRAAAKSIPGPSASPSAAIRLSFDETNRLLALCGFRHDQTVASRPGTTLRMSQGLTARRSARELTLSIDPTFVPASMRARQ